MSPLSTTTRSLIPSVLLALGVCVAGRETANARPPRCQITHGVIRSVDSGRHLLTVAVAPAGSPPLELSFRTRGAEEGRLPTPGTVAEVRYRSPLIGPARAISVRPMAKAADTAAR